jgi:hypothetical protein
MRLCGSFTWRVRTNLGSRTAETGASNRGDSFTDLRAFEEEMDGSDVSLFIDEAQFCKGKFQGLFLTHCAPRRRTDLFHALATSAGSLTSGARVVFCGTHPRMYVLREVNTAQGGPTAFSLSTHVSADMMVESLVRHLEVSEADLRADKEVIRLLGWLEGRAAHFFGDGWSAIRTRLKDTTSDESTVACVKEALRIATQKRVAVMTRVWKAFVKLAPQDMQNAVLDAVLWSGGVLKKKPHEAWPDALIQSGLAVVPSDDAVAIDLASEPLLHERLLESLAAPKPLQEATGFGAYLRGVVREKKGLGWEKTFALHALVRGWKAEVALEDVLGRVAVKWPASLAGARVSLERTPSARYDLFSCLFDGEGNPLDGVLAVNFNSFAGPDAAFLAQVGGKYVLVLVRSRNDETGTVVDAVKSVTLGRIGKKITRAKERDYAERMATRSAVTRRVRANVAMLRARSATAKHAFDNAIRVVAHPFAFDDAAVRRIEEFNSSHPTQPILLVTKDPAAVHSTIIESAADKPVPSMTLGPAEGDSALERKMLDDLVVGEEPFAPLAAADMPEGVTAEERQALESAWEVRRVLTGCGKDMLVRICDKLGLPSSRLSDSGLAEALVDHISVWRCAREWRLRMTDVEVVNEWVESARRDP